MANREALRGASGQGGCRISHIGSRMSLCPRCHRGHQGVCGVPAGVSRGFGARVVHAEGNALVHGRPGVRFLPTQTLEAMLTEAREQYRQVLQGLRTLPGEAPDYAAQLDKEGELDRLVRQLLEQIAVRRGK